MGAGVFLAVSAVRGVADAAGSGEREPLRPVAARSHVVRPGDTVWSIAERVAGEGEDPRPMVDAILRANGVAPGALVPGQLLEIPASG